MTRQNAENSESKNLLKPATEEDLVAMARQFLPKGYVIVKVIHRKGIPKFYFDEADLV